MERDFMGLSSKNVLAAVKEENTDGCRDSAPARGSAMQRSFSNNMSPLPQYLSFKASQEDRPKKTGFDSLASAGLGTISTAEAFDPRNKPYSGFLQKNSSLEMQAGTHYTMTSYSSQHFNAHSVHHPNEFKTPPIANQMISVDMSTPVHQSFVASAGQNLIGFTANPQPLGGVPIIGPILNIPTSSSIVVTTDLRNGSQSPGAPAQLTIFYGGSVSVYDDVSPEKAQAIMLLAGNGPPVTPTTILPAAQVQATMPKPLVSDGFAVNQSQSTAPCAILSTPNSITSHTVSQSAGGSNSTNDITAAKPIGALISPSTKSEPSKVLSSVGSIPGTLIPSAVPQFRQASLARFLEKRKERIMTASPYITKQLPDCGTPGSGSSSFSVNASGSCALPASN